MDSAVDSRVESVDEDVDFFDRDDGAGVAATMSLLISSVLASRVPSSAVLSLVGEVEVDENVSTGNVLAAAIDGTESAAARDMAIDANTTRVSRGNGVFLGGAHVGMRRWSKRVWAPLGDLSRHKEVFGHNRISDWFYFRYLF